MRPIPDAFDHKASFILVGVQGLLSFIFYIVLGDPVFLVFPFIFAAVAYKIIIIDFGRLADTGLQLQEYKL